MFCDLIFLIQRVGSKAHRITHAHGSNVKAILTLSPHALDLNALALPGLALLQMHRQPLQHLADRWPSDAKAEFLVAFRFLGCVGGIHP